MSQQKMLSKASVLLIFLALAAWAIWSETSEFAAAERAAVAAMPETGDGAWRRARVWDDGRAEYCVYEATWRRYGELYPGRVQLVLVKEPWAPDLEVKADQPRDGGFEVLKLNYIRDVPTGVYTYHQMASVFVRRDSGLVQKLSVMSSEACGLSTARMTGGVLETSSYFDGQGTTSRPYPPSALPEDGLPLLLRGWVGTDPPAGLEVFPSLMAGRFPPLEATLYRASRRELGEIELPAGTFEAVELSLESADARLRYVFDRRPPHQLLEWGRDDGTAYRLAKCERIAYWQLNRPGDETWFPETLRWAPAAGEQSAAEPADRPAAQPAG